MIQLWVYTLLRVRGSYLYMRGCLFELNGARMKVRVRLPGCSCAHLLESVGAHVRDRGFQARSCASA